MSLVICPECGNELSTTAVACPNCGFAPNVANPVTKRVLVETEPKNSLPKWVLIPALTLVGVLLLVIFVMMRNNSDPNAQNVNVELTKTKGTPARGTTVSEIQSNPPSQIVIPSNPSSVNPPEQPVTTVPSSQQTVPSTASEPVRQPQATKGTVKIEAKVANKNGSTQSVKNEKFYLLDEDIESILSKARLEPIESNSLSNSFGLSVLYPDRYSDFNRKALEAIKKHIKYSVLTDAAGKAVINEVNPESYYLFGITKSKNGFAMWNSMVNVNTGENILTLSPATFNEIDNSGE